MKKLKSAGSLSDQAYDVIKNAIINNEIKPLEYLIEEQIAEKLGISRTPIRTALKKLAYEGLVEMETAKHTRVRMISVEEVQEYQVVRESLEPLVAKLACQSIDSEQLAFLKDICNQQQESIDEKDYSQFINLDTQFHCYLAEFTNNHKLKEFISSLRTNLQRYLILTNTIQSSAPEAVKEHYQILDALERKDSTEASELMLNHIKNVSKRFLIKPVK
ncbi:GntR family transcriptional regulator [Bacillus sp. AFS055030]|uniref:GntR family transcriptional regulator n=1 Tax=Bacillus sp. AFS055030 TaxID=2033507 RepID=UPI000BFC8F85|nr:GntR family transcriptional regulator [Bacillus sp. AFS055030]PGL70193.1 GntR family transcriptional regulator [Bacillus sp. AFS055030]